MSRYWKLRSVVSNGYGSDRSYLLWPAAHDALLRIRLMRVKLDFQKFAELGATVERSFISLNIAGYFEHIEVDSFSIFQMGHYIKLQEDSEVNDVLIEGGSSWA